jgi:hypothetical protein
MSNCCKQKCCLRFLPHNWLCLKGLSISFLVLFYILLILWLVQVGFIVFSGIPALRLAGASSRDILVALWGQAPSLITPLVLMLVFLAMSKILKALRKIVHAVAPCQCHQEVAQEEQEEVKEVTEEAK